MFRHTIAPKLPQLKVHTTPSGIRHYITPDGNEYPSITTMLGHKEKPWLEDWRQMLGAENAAKETKRCTDRGSAVHSLIEKYLDNQEHFLDGVQREYVAGFNQIKPRLNQIDNIRIQEAALYSNQLRLAGRVDCIGEFDGVLSIIDFKTSNNNKDRSMIQDYLLQCTAYAIMWHELTQEPVEAITILMTVERGMFPLVFQDKIDKYVKPLLQRTHEYYKAH